MSGYIWAFLIISLNHMSNYKVIDKYNEQIKKWAIVKYVESSLEFCAKILKRYSIWIFHCTVYTLLFATELTYVSMLLCFVEVIVFPVQLYQWLNTKEEVYISLQRSWKYIFNLIIANAFYKYVTFFGRYVTIQHVYRNFFSMFMPEKLMVFLMDWNSTKVDRLQTDYFFEALLLVMAFYTNKCILDNATKEMTTSTGLDEKFIELAANPEQKTNSYEYRRTTTFTTLLLILKGFTFLFIGFHTMNNTNAFKVVLILVPLIYYNILFIKIGHSISQFKIRDLITKCKLLLPRYPLLLQDVRFECEAPDERTPGQQTASHA
jgi:hypothetical protein